MWVDSRHPANAGVLASLRRHKGRAKRLVPPDGVSDPYMDCGCHPEVVEWVWDPLGPALPQVCRCILYGTPVLVHPGSGVVLAVSYGTEYCLRIPACVASEARRRGAKTSMTWTVGGRTNLQKEFGRDWVFGVCLAQEKRWCELAYQAFAPVTVDPGWLAWNDGTVRKIAQMIYRTRGFEQMPILADALEEAGCTNQDLLLHCREPGEHVRACRVLGLLLGKPARASHLCSGR